MSEWVSDSSKQRKYNLKKGGKVHFKRLMTPERNVIDTPDLNLNLALALFNPCVEF